MTKERLKTVAMNLFSKHGYKETTLAAIANEVGIKPPSIYAFFASKEKLFLAVLEESLMKHYLHIQIFIEYLYGESVHDKLFQVIDCAAQFHLAHPIETKFIQRALLFPPSELEEEIQKKFTVTENLLISVLQALFQEGIEKGDIKKQPIDDLVDAFLCLMDGVFLQMIYYDLEKFRYKLNSIWKIFWNGISRNEEEAY